MSKFLSIVLVLAFAGSVIAQEAGPKPKGPMPPPKETPPAGEPPKGEPKLGATGGTEAVEGLQKLTRDILAAARTGDKEKLSPMMQGLILQTHDVWFKKVFGPEIGGDLAAAYAKRQAGLEQELTRIYTDRAKEEGADIKVVKIERGGKDLTPRQHDVLAAMKEASPLYVVRFQKLVGSAATGKPGAVVPLPPPPAKGADAVPPGKGDARMPPEKPGAAPPIPGEAVNGNHEISFFAFVDGGFRYLGELKEIVKKTETPKGEPPKSVPPKGEPPKSELPR
ncbi:MAG: hypothetical protein HYZ53_17940 [Planctomycetes bacterium]|nr:hypothetical protein [Planctomycetota bacterium]